MKRPWEAPESWPPLTPHAEQFREWLRDWGCAEILDQWGHRAWRVPQPRECQSP